LPWATRWKAFGVTDTNRTISTPKGFNIEGRGRRRGAPWLPETQYIFTPKGSDRGSKTCRSRWRKSICISGTQWVDAKERRGFFSALFASSAVDTGGCCCEETNGRERKIVTQRGQAETFDVNICKDMKGVSDAWRQR
jgi:hypothetical protein